MKYIALFFIAVFSIVTGIASAFFYLGMLTLLLSLLVDGPELTFDPSYTDYGVGMLAALFGIPLFIVLVPLFSFAIWQRLKKASLGLLEPQDIHR